mgnify:CR=1 FL=1
MAAVGPGRAVGVAPRCGWGGAGGLAAELAGEWDEVALVRRQLGIAVREDRYQAPDDPPAETEKRYWRPTEQT